MVATWVVLGASLISCGGNYKNRMRWNVKLIENYEAFLRDVTCGVYILGRMSQI